MANAEHFGNGRLHVNLRFDVGELVASSPLQCFDLLQALFSGQWTISNRPAAPMPPPMHIVTTPYFALRRRPSIKM